jgi:lipopolysaccharide export LptBFGC system permease protein LptF
MFGSRRWNLYVLRELMTPTLLGLLLYTFVLLMNHFFLVAEKALAKNLSPELTLQLFMAGIPKLLVLSIPMSVLLGTLIGLGRLSADREWVALQAAGHGPAALFRPVFLHGLIGTLVTFVIYVVIVPQTNYMVRNLRGQVLFSSNLAADLTPRVLYDLPDDAVIHVEDIRSGGERRLENVLLIQPDPDKEGLTQLVVARFGDLHPASDGSGALLVDLYHGEAHYYRSDQPEKYQVATFDSVVGKVAGDFSLAQLMAEIREARAERDSLQAVGGQHPERLRMAERRVARTQVELHRRLAVPAACLCFALLALPLGLTTARSGKGAGFATSVLVIIVYRLVFVATTNQAMLGRIPAPLGPWAPDLLIFLWAGVALWRMRARPSARRGSLFTLPLTLWRRVGTAARQPVIGERESTEEPEPGVEEPTLTALTGTTRRFVARLDRYVAVAFLRIFAFSLVSVYLIYAVVEGQELIDKTLRTKQPMSLVADYLLYFPPGVLYVVLPIASLIGAVVSITLLARSSELVHATGHGPDRAHLDDPRRAALPRAGSHRARLQPQGADDQGPDRGTCPADPRPFGSRLLALRLRGRLALPLRPARRGQGRVPGPQRVHPRSIRAAHRRAPLQRAGAFR